MNLTESKTYKINEIFYSLQGEGLRAGSASIFIRFAGCNLKCNFCDTDHNAGMHMTLDNIASAIKDYSCDWLVLTGGEPTLFVDNKFVDFFHALGYKIAIETNGTKDISYNVDYITLSPKIEYVQGADVRLTKYNEIKVVYNGINNMSLYDKYECANMFLQPCDTGNSVANKGILTACIDYILKHPKWRLSLQTQKIVNIK